MSDTPRTDALTARMASELGRPALEANHVIDLCDHARQLERELADAKFQLRLTNVRANPTPSPELLEMIRNAPPAIRALFADVTRNSQAKPNR